MNNARGVNSATSVEERDLLALLALLDAIGSAF